FPYTTLVRSGAVRTGTRVCLAPDPHPAVREALDRAGLMDFFETDGGVEACAAPGPVAEDGGTLPPSVNDVQHTNRVSWAQLVELEPQVQELLWRARLAGANCHTFLDVQSVFGPLKNELTALVGFAGQHHRHPLLGRVGAYEVACSKLYDAVAGLVAGRAAGGAAVPEGLCGRTAPGPCAGESRLPE